MIRMGPHRHTGKRDAELRRYVDAARPQFVKFLDAFPADLAVYCHERGTRVVGRVYFQQQELGAGGGRQVREVIDTARRNPHVDYWELHNEDWQSGNDMARYAELSIEFMRGLEALDRKAAIGCFSTGQPEVEAWKHFLPALRHAAAHGHAVALHEYGGGPIGAKWGVGRNQWNDGAPVTDDACDDPGTYYLGWWCLRYRRAVAEWRRLGLATTPDILITEALIDDIQPRPGNQGKGWRDFKNQHPPHVGDYADQWAWYCRQISRDPYVIGAVDFGWATADPTWNSFDLSQEPAMLERVTAAMRGLIEETPAPTPAPVPGAPSIVSRPSAHYSSRAGERASWIVVHSTDTPVGGTPEGTAAYLAQNDRLVSVHELVTPGRVYLMVGDGAAAHHAGNATLGDGTTGAAVNRVSWGIEIFQIHGQPCAPDLVDVAARRITEACRRLGITDTARIVGHREIDPGRRSDPVGVDMGALRARVLSLLGGAPAPAPGVDVEALKAAARAEHARAGVRLNGGSAIQRTMLADGAWPTTNEATLGGITYARGESHIGGAWLYWWENGKVRRARL